MYIILSSLTRLIAPLLSYTAEEIWQHLPQSAALDMGSVFYNDLPEASGVAPADPALWETLLAARVAVQKAMELKRAAKVIGKSLEAKVTLHCDGPLYDTLTAAGGLVSDLLIASQVEVAKGGNGEVQGDLEGLSVTVEKAVGGKCARCWKVLPEVGADPEYPDLCPRCAAAVKSLVDLTV